MANVFYNSENGSSYQWVASPGITWAQAKSFAEGSSFNGQHGYLATITTVKELNFIDQVVFATGRPDNTFIGGSDALEEGVWRWVTGPEGDSNGGAGTVFFNKGNYVGEKVADWQSLSGGYTSGGDSLLLYSWWQPFFNPWNDSTGAPVTGGPAGYLIEWAKVAANNYFPTGAVTITGTSGNDTLTRGDV